MNDPSCKACKFSRAHQQPGAVLCKRNPPQMMLLPSAAPSIQNPNAQTMQLMPIFPMLIDTEDCGEFSPRVLQ